MFLKKQLLADIELTMQCQSEPRKETKFICILNYVTVSLRVFARVV